MSPEFTLVPLTFLCLQAMVWYAAAEVGYRYLRWYIATARASQGLLLSSLVLGIAITHFSILADRSSWMFENFAHPLIMDQVQTALADQFLRLVIIRTILYVGILVHLIPIYRIVLKYAWWEIVLTTLLRSAVAIVVYLTALQLWGVLYCFTHTGCPLG